MVWLEDNIEPVLISLLFYQSMESKLGFPHISSDLTRLYLYYNLSLKHKFNSVLQN